MCGFFGSITSLMTVKTIKFTINTLTIRHKEALDIPVICKIIVITIHNYCHKFVLNYKISFVINWVWLWRQQPKSKGKNREEVGVIACGWGWEGEGGAGSMLGTFILKHEAQ